MINMHRFFSEHRHAGPFQKGGLKYIILDLINDKPRYGYEIIRVLEKHSHGFYSPSAGAIYPTLQMLEEMGYVTSNEQDGKKVYTITEEGKKFTKEREHFAEEIKEKMRHHWNPHNICEIGETMGEFRRLGRLLRRQFRDADTDKNIQK